MNNIRQKKLPTSGSEGPFTDFVYGSPVWGKLNNSCYPFALDWFRSNGNKKLQPGQLAGTYKKTDDLTDAETLKKRTIEDLKTKRNGGYIAKPCERCKDGFYKIMAFTQPGVDFHWYRQVGDIVVDNDKQKSVNNLSKNTNLSKNKINAPESGPILLKDSGLFAHKRGHSILTVKDASDNFIKDPRRANRDYGSVNYTDYVASFCVNKNFGKGQPVDCREVNKK